VVVRTADGGRGEYVAQWVAIYEDLKRDIRPFAHMGHGPIDIALWDWAGKRCGASIGELLGGYRKRLPAYASTYHADRAGGLHCKEAFVDFARHCRSHGYRAFRIHGWNDGDAREEAENVLHVAKHVGHEMTLMLDPACELRTFADALRVGRACDEAGFCWYEDPYRDGGTDFVRVDPEYDMGITGSLKIAHLAESLGLDCEIHASGPTHRHLMSALRNPNFREVARVGPDCPNAPPPVDACGCTDRLDCVGEDGCVDVPTGPGLGVTYDWAFIAKHRTTLHVFE
jgi:L-alanine-DL-glutamate epimerase-like enolase superfamily enzyme